MDSTETEAGGETISVGRSEEIQEDRSESEDVPTTPVSSLEARPSFHLREAWPQTALSGGAEPKHLVVCTVDIQLLTDTVQVMHTQIDLLRQTILDLRRDALARREQEGKEMKSLRRKLGDLEKRPALRPSVLGATNIRLDKMENKLKALELAGSHSPEVGIPLAEISHVHARIEHLESAVWGENPSTNSQEGGEQCFDEDEGDVESETTDRIFREESDDPRGMAEIIDNDQWGRGEDELVEETVEVTGEDVNVPAGPLTSSILDDGEAPEPMQEGEGDERNADVTEIGSGAGTRPRNKLKSVGMTVIMARAGALCPKVLKMEERLRSLLKREQEVRLAARVAALEAMGNHKIEAERQKAEQRRSLLLKLLQQSEFLRTALAAEGTAQVSQTQEDSLWMDGTGSPAEVTEGNGGLIERTRARLLWIEAHIGHSPGNSDGEAPGKPVRYAWMSEQDSNNENADDSRALTSTGEAITPGEILTGADGESLAREGNGNDAIGARRGEGDEIESLWRRMGEAGRRIFQHIVERRRAEQMALPPGEGVSSAITERLHELHLNLERSSSALATRFEKGLKTFGSRIDVLEERPVHHPSLDGEVAKRTAALQEMQGALQGVVERMGVLETATAEHTEAAAEMAAEAAEKAARNETEQSEVRVLAEMSALEERVDRRAREDARRAKEERDAAEAGRDMRHVSDTVAAYTADLASRLEGLRSEHERQGSDVARTAEDIASAEDNLRRMGEELVGLGQVANTVSGVVDEKADQTDLEVLRQTMSRLDSDIKSKDRAASAARDAEALAALQTAFKEMSSSMEGSLQKLQQAQQSAGTIKMKPLLDRVIKELTSAGLLRDPNSDHGGAGRSICLSCNRPMSVGADSGNTRNISHGQGTLGARMASASSSSLHVTRPAAVWRGGFRMPPSKLPSPLRAPQGSSTKRTATSQDRGIRRSAGAISSPSMTSDPRGVVADSKLPGIPHMLESPGTGTAANGGVLRSSAEGPHRAKFVKDTRAVSRRRA